jgi:hypothetical protein
MFICLPPYIFLRMLQKNPLPVTVRANMSAPCTDCPAGFTPPIQLSSVGVPQILIPATSSEPPQRFVLETEGGCETLIGVYSALYASFR